LIVGQNPALNQVPLITGPNLTVCGGGTVATMIAQRELTSSELSAINDEIFIGYYSFLGITPSDIISGSQTAFYNNHAYTFYKTEGYTSNYVILPGTNNSNISTFWNSSTSCFELSTEAQAEKIHYVSSDHSAVKSSVAGKYESKWGNWYVVRHSPNQIPYYYTDPTQRAYYRRRIAGANFICYGQSQQYAVYNPPSGTISWVTSSNLNVSGSGNSVSISTNYNSSPGTSGSISFRVNGTEIAKKDVWIGVPQAPIISGPTSVPVSSQSVTYNASSITSATSYEWSWNSNPSNPMYNYGNYVNIYFNVAGTSQLSLRACNTCGCGPWQYLYINATSGSFITYYPNPVSDILHIDVAAKSSAEDARSANASYEIRLYDELGSQLRQAVAKSETGVQFDVSGLPDGTYYLHVYDGVNAKPEMYQIIVRH
jgi:hypothetical protein